LRKPAETLACNAAISASLSQEDPCASHRIEGEEEDVVAFKSTRRQPNRFVWPVKTALDALCSVETSAAESHFHAMCSHRTVRYVETRTNRRGELVEVRIGRWRVIAATAHRRLAEVRELGGDRVAVRIERLADNGQTSASEIWQLYDRDGRLEAAVQSTPDGSFALLTNYRTRQACRLAAASNGELRPVETWTI
jgi:hypothetical protein